MQPPYQLRHFVRYDIQSLKDDNATALVQFALSECFCCRAVLCIREAYMPLCGVRLSVRLSDCLSPSCILLNE